MRKNLFCPNLSLPENKALVKKLGLFGFYKEYVRNNFNIPQSVYEDVYDGTLSVEQMVYVNKDLFTGTQQDEVVDSILYQVQQYRLAGENNVNTIKSNVLNDFKETVDYFKSEYEGTNEADDIINALTNVINNYDAFYDKVTKKLASQDITVDSNDTASFNDEESTYDSAENLNQKLNYSDDSNFKQSSKDTASANFKIALSLIPKYVYENGDVVLDEDGNPQTELSFIGSPTFESMDSIWSDLLFSLNNVPIGSKLNYLNNSTNPKHRMIAKHIMDNPDVSIRNQFESVFSKQQAKFVTVSYSKPDSNGIKSIKVMDTNRMNADNLLIDFWYESFLNSSAVEDYNGNKRVDSNYGKELNARYNSLLNLIKTDLDAGLIEAKKLLKEIGVEISMKALKSEGVWVNKELQTPVRIINNLKYVFNSLSGNSEQEADVEDILEVNNPYVNEKSTFDLLAKLENRANPNVFEASFVSGDGKAKYSFVNHTYASLQTQKLKTDVAYLTKLKSTGYASGSFYLNKLIEDSAFREIFDLQYVDTLGNDSVNQTNKTFSSMNTKEKELTKISLFQNAGRGTTVEDANIGKFIGLVPSDKTTIPVFNTLKVNVKSSPKLNADGNYNFNADTLEVIYDQFMSEYSRVKQTFKEIGNPDVRQIAEYHTGAQMGKRFIIFPFLNSTLIKNGVLVELDDNSLQELVKPKLQKFLSDLTKDQINYWKELGIFPTASNYNNFFDKSWAKKAGLKLPVKPKKNKGEHESSYKARLAQWETEVTPDLTKAGNAVAASYAINQFVFMMNQTQLFSGDPALHGKSVLKDLDPDTGDAYSKSWINFYKRMAKDIAPGTDGNFGENATYNTIFLKDFKLTSAQYMEYLEKVGDVGLAYDGMNPADAQEYTTLDEHLTVMRAYGRLSAQQEEAAQRLKEGSEDINDIQLILQPMKPVYVNSQIEGGINTMYYIKSSSFPLIPALTRGLQIDKLRQFMESNNIQRAAYESAAKLGIQGQLANLSDNGGIEFKDLTPDDVTVINLSRSGFRLQQEMPYHGDHTDINEGSQGRKLVLNNLLDSEVINYNGKQYTGNQVKEIFERLHIEKMDRAMSKLIDDLGFRNEDGTFELTDISKIQKMIQQEAESRNYPVNDLYSIQLVEENGRQTFKVPISFTNNATRFESILNSIFTNRVIKSELPGFMSIQGASSGFQKIMSDEDFNESVFSSGVTWIDPTDTKLEYIREKDGSILAADILVPNFLRDNSGNKIDVRNYIVDGKLDTSRIPEDLLTVIGLRIPTQGYNSMMKFRVKGFLPDMVGDLAIVPAEVTIQMGSDFDVDKLFIYRYHHKMDKSGNLKKITSELADHASEIDYSKLSLEQIDNLIIQTFEDRLSDPNMLEQILTPNGFGNLPEVAAEVAKLDKSAKSKHSFTTREQNNISNVNVAGKMGTAQFSLFSTFFKAAQDAKLTIRNPFKVTDSKGQVHTLNSLSEINNVEGQKRSDVIMYLQSAAVDNAKEQILGKLNINDYTMGVAGTMSMLGYSDEFIGYFLSQPILKEFTDIVSNANDIVSGTSDPEAKIKAIAQLEENFQVDNDKLNVINKFSEVPISVKQLKEYLTNNSTTDLPTGLSPEELNVVKETNNFFQLQVLKTFGRLLELSENVQTLQSATNLDTKGLGATYGAVQAKSLQLLNVFKGVNTPEYPILGADRLFAGNTVQRANQVLFDANNMLGKIYTYNSVSYQKIIKNILNEASLSPTEGNLKDIYANLKSFLLTNPNLLNLEEINTVRDSLLYGKDNIAQRWLNYTNSPEGKRNPLTKRITPKFSKSNEDYNGVKAINTPASNNSQDINSSIMYFYDMLNSSNTVEKQLAEDLVRYHVLTGAQYGAQSIGKYITFDVLEKYDFSKKLRDIDKILNNSEVFDNFVRQYFQNNPFKATSFDIETIGGETSEQISVSANNNPFRNSNNEALTYFSVYDSQARTPVLYELSDENTSYLVYSKIPVTGNKFIKKYDYLDNSIGAINVQDREVLPTATNPIMNALKEPTVDTAENLFKQAYGFNSTAEILDNIKNKSNNAYFVKIATDLLNSNALDNVKVVYSEDRLANGWFTNNTVYINANAISSFNGDIIAKFEEVVLHELLHAGTVNSIDNYDNLPDNKKKAVKKIQRLYSEYVKNHPNKAELDRYTQINESRLAGNKLSQEDKQFLIENKSKYYHLTNVKEFIAAGLTNPDVTTELRSNNLWTKFIDFVAELLGVNRNDLDFLYQSTIDLIDGSESNVQVVEDLFAPNDEYNRLEFVRQRDEFLRAHKTFIGKRVTDATLKKFQESQASKEKYNRLKISSWNGELRVSRVDPVYEDIADTTDKKESPKDKVINSYIARLKDSLKRFERRKRQLGDDVDPLLDSKINKLKDKIKYLEAERSVSSFMSTAEEKIDDISKNIDSYDDIDSVNDALSYISALKSVNESLEFTEDFADWNDRLDKIAAKAVKLEKRIKTKGANLLSEHLKDNVTIDFNVSEALTKGITDTKWAESKFLDGTQSSSKHIQAIEYMINRFQFDANQDHDTFNEQFIPLVEAYKKKYGTDYKQLLQTDKAGNPTGFLLNKYSQDFYDKAKGNFRFYIKNTTATLSDENKEKYEADKKQAFENLTTSDYTAWEADNNPYTFMDTWKSGKNSIQRGARRYVKIEPTDKWIDTKYTMLKSLPETDPARELYDFIEPILRRNNKRYGQQANFIPEMQKTAVEMLLDGKTKNSLGKVKEDIVNAFTNDLTVNKSDIDVLTGEPRLHIPVNMFDAKLEADKKSYDLANITEKVKYQEIALSYKYKAEPILNLYYSILKDAKQFHKYDDSGNPVTINKPASRVIEQSQFLIQNYLYNRNRTLNDTEAKYGKATDVLISYARLAGMGWNPFSAIGNVGQGLTSNFTYAADGRYFTKKDYTKATGLMMHTLAGNLKTSKKIAKMFAKFDTFVKTNELNYGKSKELATATQSKLVEAVQPYNMQQKGEYFIQGQTMLGILLNTKVETPTGEKISVFDGYDDNGVWQEKYGEDPFADKDKLFKMTMKIRKAIIDVHGNYSRPIAAKQDFGWRMAMMFRTWLPQALNVRFGGETTDILTETTTKGRYLSYPSMFKTADGKLDLQATADNLKWLIGLKGNTSLTQLDKDNMRKNMAELAMIVVITLAIAAIKAGLDDIDDEDKIYVNYVLNSLSRTSNDLTFFLLPSSANTILQDPIPLMRTINNTIDVLPAAWNYIIGEDEYKTGSRKGRSKLGKEITDLIPFITQVDKNWNYMNQVFDDRR